MAPKLFGISVKVSCDEVQNHNKDSYLVFRYKMNPVIGETVSLVINFTEIVSIPGVNWYKCLNSKPRD